MFSFVFGLEKPFAPYSPSLRNMSERKSCFFPFFQVLLNSATLDYFVNGPFQINYNVLFQESVPQEAILPGWNSSDVLHAPQSFPRWRNNSLEKPSGAAPCAPDPPSRILAVPIQWHPVLWFLLPPPFLVHFPFGLREGVSDRPRFRFDRRSSPFGKLRHPPFQDGFFSFQEWNLRVSSLPQKSLCPGTLSFYGQVVFVALFSRFNPSALEDVFSSPHSFFLPLPFFGNAYDSRDLSHTSRRYTTFLQK